MLLSTHRLIEGIAQFNPGDGPSSPFVYNDTASSVRHKLNYSLGAVEDYVEEIEVTVEDVMAAVFGNGVVYGLEPSVGTGLNIDYTAGYALIGFTISKDAGSISVPPNYNPGYVFLKQDGSWEVNSDGSEPSDMESFLYCTFVSNASSVVSVSTSMRALEKVLPAKLRRISGTHGIVVPLHSSRDYFISHTYSIEIPGYITVSSDRPDVIVSVIDLEDSTSNGFWIRLTHDPSYGYEYSYAYYYNGTGYYGEYTIISWERTGLGYNTE